MTKLTKRLVLKYKLSISVFETLNKIAYSTQVRPLGTGVKMVNAILSHDTFSDAILPKLIGKNSKSTDWEETRQEYIRSLQIYVPENGQELILDFIFDRTSEQYKTAIADYIKEHKLYETKDSKNTPLDDKSIIVHIFANKSLDVIDYHKYFKFDNPQHYLWWTIASLSAQVANNVEDVSKSTNIRFFLYDEKEFKRNELTKAKEKELAISKLSDIKSKDKDLIKHIAIASKKVSYEDSLLYSDDDIYLTMFQFANEEPTTFLSYFKDANIATVALIQKFIDCNILSVDDDGQIVESANHKNVIGASKEQAISWFKNPLNEGDINKLKNKLKQINV